MLSLMTVVPLAEIRDRLSEYVADVERTAAIAGSSTPSSSRPAG